MQQVTGQLDRQKYLGGYQSKRVPLLNEGLVRHLYYTERMTLVEVSNVIGCQEITVRKFMAKLGMSRRIAAKRNQAGENNSTWAGENVCYKAAHQRVYRARGRPKKCEHCQTTDESKNYEWANVSGKHHDINDYIRLCRSCHCKYDGLLNNLGEYACVPPQNRT